jgi:hypothetical protein
MDDLLSSVIGRIAIEIVLIGTFSTATLFFCLFLFREFLFYPIMIGKMNELDSTFRTPLLVIIGLILVYWLGVMTNSIADRWIDKPFGYAHLFLGKVWVDKEYYEGNLKCLADKKGIDDAIKIVTLNSFTHNISVKIDTDYYNFLIKHENKCCEGIDDEQLDRFHDDIKKFYKYALHHVFDKNQIGKEELFYIKGLIRVSRIWTFCMFVVFLSALLRLLIILISRLFKIKGKMFEIGFFKIGMLTISVLFSFSMYCIGGSTWLHYEKDYNKTLYALFLENEIKSSNCILKQIKYPPQ